MNIRTSRALAVAIDRREQIKGSALRTFARKGFVQSSLQDIADELGITREAIYYYYGNKKEILLSMILSPSQLMFSKEEEIVAADIPVQKKMEQALRSHLEHFTPVYLEVSTVLREKSLLEDEDFAELRRQWKRYEKIWFGIISDGQREGLFYQDMNPKVTTYAVLGMLNWLSRWYRPDGEISVEELLDNFYKLCANGLLVKRASRKSI
jgi:AcrR family transcriptional regulator